MILVKTAEHGFCETRKPSIVPVAKLLVLSVEIGEDGYLVFTHHERLGQFEMRTHTEQAAFQDMLDALRMPFIPSIRPGDAVTDEHAQRILNYLSNQYVARASAHNGK